MTSADGNSVALPISSTLDMTGTGLDKLDTGTVASSTWYYIWAVSNGTMSGIVASTSSSAPNASITNNYPYYARLAATLRTNGSGNLLATKTRGKKTQYVVGGTNLTGLPLMASGAAGAYTGGYVTTWANVSVTNYVPTNVASRIMGISFVAGSGITNVAPNSSYGASYTNSGPGMAVGGACASSSGVTLQYDYMLEGTNIVWAATGGVELYVQGWEDNI
jgi:hypothetical protein